MKANLSYKVKSLSNFNYPKRITSHLTLNPDSITHLIRQTLKEVKSGQYFSYVNTRCRVKRKTKPKILCRLRHTVNVPQQGQKNKINSKQDSRSHKPHEM